MMSSNVQTVHDLGRQVACPLPQMVKNQSPGPLSLGLGVFHQMVLLTTEALPSPSSLSPGPLDSLLHKHSAPKPIPNSCQLSPSNISCFPQTDFQYTTHLELGTAFQLRASVSVPLLSTSHKSQKLQVEGIFARASPVSSNSPCNTPDIKRSNIY